MNFALSVNTRDINLTDTNGWTPLCWAAKNGHEAMVWLLLEKGAAFDEKDNNGLSLLRWAAWNGPEAVVELLLEREPLSTQETKMAGRRLAGLSGTATKRWSGFFSKRAQL